MAQRNIRIISENDILTEIRNRGYKYHMNIPSDSVITQFGSPTGTVTAGQTNSIGQGLIPAGKNFIPKSISINVKTTQDLIVLIRGVDINTSFYEILSTNQLEPNTYGEHWEAFKASGEINKVIDISGWGRMREFSAITVRYFASKEGLTTPFSFTTPYVQATVIGHMCDDDLNLNANRNILVVADSYGHTNCSDPSSVAPNYKDILGRNYFPKVFRDKMLSDGKNVRIINRSFGGATSLTVQQQNDGGYWDQLRTDADIFSIGFNDAASSWDATIRQTFKNRLQSWIDRRRLFNGNAPIFLCGAYPAVSTDTVRNAVYLSTTKIQDIRDATNEVVIANASRNVFFVNFGDVYINTDNTNFSANPSDNKVHASTIGQSKIGQRLYDRFVASVDYSNF